MPLIPSPGVVTDRARTFWSLAPSRRDHIPAVRIAAGLAGPLIILLLLDRTPWAMYAAFGAFTGIYSRYEPTRQRFARQSFIGVMLTLSVGVGAAVSQLGATVLPETWTPIVILLVGAFTAASSATIITAKGLKPGGAVFPVFAVTAVATAPPAAPIWLATLIAFLSAGWCVLLGLAMHFLGERHPDVEPKRPPRYTRMQLAQEFTLYGCAALVAGVFGVLSGLPSAYWAQIAAVAPLSAPGRTAQIERGLHRVVGTVLGVVVTAFLLSFPTQPWQLVVWVVLLQFCAEMYVLRNYSFALLFITPLALLMVQLAHPQPAGPLLQARIVETAIGATVGMSAVIITHLLTRGRRRADERRAAEQKSEPEFLSREPTSQDDRAGHPHEAATATEQSRH